MCMEHVQNDFKLMSWQHVGSFWNIVLHFGIFEFESYETRGNYFLFFDK